MLSHKFVFRESKNFTSGRGIRAPPTVPIHHDGVVVVGHAENDGALWPTRLPRGIRGSWSSFDIARFDRHRFAVQRTLEQTDGKQAVERYPE